MKYDPNGNVLWAKQAGGTGYDYAEGVAVFGNKVYVCGHTELGSPQFDVLNFTPVGIDSWLVSMDAANGNFLDLSHTAGASSASHVVSEAVAVDSSGNVVVCGSTNLGFSWETKTFTDQSGIDMWIAYFDNTMNIQWLKSFTGGDEEAHSVVPGILKARTGPSLPVSACDHPSAPTPRSLRLRTQATPATAP